MIQRVFEFESVLLLLQQFLPYKNLISPGFRNLRSVVCRTQNPNLITLFNKVAGHVGGGVSMDFIAVDFSQRSGVAKENRA